MIKQRIKQGEMLSSTTVRIEAIDEQGNEFTSTGFYYSLSDSSAASYIPVVITNKHVIDGMKDVQLVMTKADNFGNRLEEHITYKIKDVLEGAIFHPDPEIDLCAISLYPIISQLKLEGIEIFTHYVTNGIIATKSKLTGLDAIEEIIMVGYPDGLWDKVNNKPIIRRGITATDSRINYNGETEFLIDAACFPGSSGSPVYHLDRSYKTEICDGVMGYEIMLLGVLYAGPQTSIKNRIETDSEFKINSFTDFPINLGYVIKAERLLEIEAEIKKKLKE